MTLSDIDALLDHIAQEPDTPGEPDKPGEPYEHGQSAQHTLDSVIALLTRPKPAPRRDETPTTRNSSPAFGPPATQTTSLPPF
jgi:hypothetical protein